MKFRNTYDELLQMLDTEQKEIRELVITIQDKTVKQSEKDLLEEKFENKCKQRGSRIVEIMDQIGALSESNVGINGQFAVATIALHSNVEIMQKVLLLLEAEHTKRPKGNARKLIPSITDRLLIIGKNKQRFGTQWSVDKNGTPFMFEVEDFSNMNELRQEYGLMPAQQPRDLSRTKFNIHNKKVPVNPPATIEDQKKSTNQEYLQYSKRYLWKLNELTSNYKKL